MMELFYMGGPLFMGILTLIALAMISWSALQAKRVFIEENDARSLRPQLEYIKSIGIFALVTGIFGQLIGLYQAFIAIEQMQHVSPALLAGGLKVSSITTLYGIVIFLLSYVIWFFLDSRITRRMAGY